MVLQLRCSPTLLGDSSLYLSHRGCHPVGSSYSTLLRRIPPPVGGNTKKISAKTASQIAGHDIFHILGVASTLQQIFSFFILYFGNSLNIFENPKIMGHDSQFENQTYAIFFPSKSSYACEVSKFFLLPNTGLHFSSRPVAHDNQNL